MVWLWVKLTGTGVPNLDSIFPAGIGNQRIGRGEGFDDKVCIAPTLFVSRCVSYSQSQQGPENCLETCLRRECFDDVTYTFSL